MTNRIDQINSLLRKELANIVSKEILIPDGLITISYVKCSPDLRHAKIGISVLPEKLGRQSIRKLKDSSSRISSVIMKKVKFKMIPKFHWEIDDTGSHVSEIEKILAEIRNENK